MPLVSTADIDTLISTYYYDLPLLKKLDRYRNGKHDTPFIPRHANDEYRLITSRCYTNFMGTAVTIPKQTLFVDGFRSTVGTNEPAKAADGPEWAAWQRSRMDSIQSAIYDGAFTFGYSMVAVSRDRKSGKSRMRGVSALRSSAIYDDPANDIVPRAAIEIHSDEDYRSQHGQELIIPGRATVYGPTHTEEIEFTESRSGVGAYSIKRISAVPHGASECPITRFPASLDLEGRCVGIIEPLIPLQDRINQSIHDLLIGQVYTSHQVRTATGMTGMVKQELVYDRDLEGNIVFDDDGHPVILETRDMIDESGRPVLADTKLNAATMLVSEDKDTKFGVLPGAPLDGFIKSIEMSLKHFATLSSTPPQYMMGSITNISADALQAADIALKRKVDLFKVVFGECWERVANVAAEIDGFDAHDEQLETLWRDMDGQSFARMADALLKLKELNVPAQGLWGMIPGITAAQLAQWQELIDEDPDQILATAMAKGAQAVTPDGPDRNQTDSTNANADPELE